MKIDWRFPAIENSSYKLEQTVGAQGELRIDRDRHAIWLTKMLLMLLDFKIETVWSVCKRGKYREVQSGEHRFVLVRPGRVGETARLEWVHSAKLTSLLSVLITHALGGAFLPL